MEIRVTRPELYLECEDPTDVERRQGYYIQCNTIKDGVKDFFETNKLVTAGEVIDVQLDKFSPYYASYRKNANGQIIKLPHSLTALSMVEELTKMWEPMTGELSEKEYDNFKQICAECSDMGIAWN